MKITGTITKIEHFSFWETEPIESQPQQSVNIYIDLDDVSEKVLSPSVICISLPTAVEIKEDGTQGHTLHVGDNVEVEFQMCLLSIGTGNRVCANTNEICLWTIVKK